MKCTSATLRPGADLPHRATWREKRVRQLGILPLEGQQQTPHQGRRSAQFLVRQTRRGIRLGIEMRGWNVFVRFLDRGRRCHRRGHGGGLVRTGRDCEACDRARRGQCTGTTRVPQCPFHQALSARLRPPCSRRVITSAQQCLQPGLTLSQPVTGFQVLSVHSMEDWTMGVLWCFKRWSALLSAPRAVPPEPSGVLVTGPSIRSTAGPRPLPLRDTMGCRQRPRATRPRSPNQCR